MDKDSFDRFLDVMWNFGYTKLTPFNVIAYMANVPKYDFPDVIENLIGF